MEGKNDKSGSVEKRDSAAIPQCTPVCHGNGDSIQHTGYGSGARH